MYGVEAVGGLKGCGGSIGGDRLGQVGTGRLVDRFGDGESVNLVWVWVEGVVRVWYGCV